jgi:hypothetical protein
MFSACSDPGSLSLSKELQFRLESGSNSVFFFQTRGLAGSPHERISDWPESINCVPDP